MLIFLFINVAYFYSLKNLREKDLSEAYNGGFLLLNIYSHAVETPRNRKRGCRVLKEASLKCYMHNDIIACTMGTYT